MPLPQTRDEDDAKCRADRAYLEGRATDVLRQWVTNLDGTFDARAAEGRTVAVLRVRLPGTGACLDILGGSGKRGKELPRASAKIAYLPNEVVAQAPGLHAEQTVLVDPSGLPPAQRLAIAASRNFCDLLNAGAGQQCMLTLQASGAQIVGPRYAVWPDP